MGIWSLNFSGDCQGRESERLHITQLDDSAIVFDEHTLSRGEDGAYSGTAHFVAAMPVDGRDIPYTISYSLHTSKAGGFRGTQTVIEDGGHGLSCPVELVFGGDS